MNFFKKSEKCSNEDLSYDCILKRTNNERLRKFYNKLSKNGKGYAYIYLNINNFNQINNAFGYDTGNIVLKNILNILDTNIANDEMVARLIADEFVLILKFDNKDNFTERFKKIIDKLENVEITNGEVMFSYNCSFCCGIYEILGSESSFEEIASVAYTTYTLTKQQQKLSFAFFDEYMKEKNELISKLIPFTKEAFTKRQIEPYFQPSYDLKSKEIIGAEVFSRWNHPQFGLIQPNDFLTVFERSGNILELDLYMLEEACKLLKKWIDDECMPVPLSVNISKFNLYEINFVEKVMNIINRYEVPVCLINMEINAIALLENQDKAFEVMTILHEKGFILSVDNFGNKHVFLDVLYKFPINILNIDHEFIEESEQSELIYRVLNSVILLSHKLGIIVSAKGVENKPQEAFLKKMKCEYVQGYFYSNPQPKDEFEKLIF